MLLPQLRAFFASSSMSKGSITQVEELLADGPATLRRITEPVSPFSLTAGSWPASYNQVSSLVPMQPGVYILVAPGPLQADDGASQVLASVYVGKSGCLRQRLRDHAGDPSRRATLSFACLSSPSGELTGDHCCALEALLQHLFDAHEAVVLEGRTEGLPVLSARDRFVVTAAASACVRMLRFCGLLLPDLQRDLQPAAEPPDQPVSPVVHAELRFEPNLKTPFADMLLIGAETSAGFVLRAGTEFRVAISHEQPRSISARREQLLAGGYLEPIPGVTGRLRLSRDVLMTSANVAARVMCGYAISNPAVHGAWQPVPGDLPEIR